MLRIAGQAAGPIGLKFFEDNPGWPGGVIGKKKIEIYFQNYFLSKFKKIKNSTGNAGLLSSFLNIIIM